MRHDELWLADILDAISEIEYFLLGIDNDKNTFQSSSLYRSAVQYQLVLIGEACGKVSEKLRSDNPNVPWIDIVGFRNFAVHQYFSTDWDLVWIAATTELATLRTDIEKILDSEIDAS